MIHLVHALPEGGTPVRTRCGRWTHERKTVALKRGDIPEGAAKCRSCWRAEHGLSARGKILLMEDLLRANPGGIPQGDLVAILEDRYYLEDQHHIESPKAA